MAAGHKRVGRVGSRGGRAIVIAGPDGTGKSTVVDALLNGPLRDTDVIRIHHRPRVLPGRATSQNAERPHAAPPYPGWLGWIKVVYLYVDHVLGWALRVRPHLRRGGWVLIERGWWDLVVDPRRYRLPSARPAELLGRYTPRSHATIVLTAPEEIILARKAELTDVELRRQLDEWARLTEAHEGTVRIDTQRPVDDVVARVWRTLATTETRAWIGLPNGRHPRWLLPRSPSAATRAGLKLYRPTTQRRMLAWTIADAAARTGAARLKPAVSLPPELNDALQDVAIEWTNVAVSRATHGARLMALLLSDGRAVAAAKIALDEPGRRALENEHRALLGAGSLEPPLRAPEVIQYSPGLLVLEAVEWKPQRAPWKLPEEVARAVGAHHRATGSFHGDLAPWNLLRTSAGWVLIDWEEAGPDYPPLFDVLHFLVQGYSLLGKPARDDLLSDLTGPGWIGRSIRAYAEGAGLAGVDPRDQALAYLEASRGRIDPSTSDGRKGLRRRGELAARLNAIGGSRAG